MISLKYGHYFCLEVLHAYSRLGRNTTVHIKSLIVEYIVLQLYNTFINNLETDLKVIGLRVVY